ncbi:hypothetical protein CIU45_05065 [Salmonella enterica]|nr:hypothetical protein [Salmonella enterica]
MLFYVDLYSANKWNIIFVIEILFVHASSFRKLQIRRTWKCEVRNGIKSNISIRLFIIVNKMINIMMICLLLPKSDRENVASIITLIFVRQLTLHQNTVNMYSC